MVSEIDFGAHPFINIDEDHCFLRVNETLAIISKEEGPSCP